MATRQLNLGFMSMRHAELPERVLAAAQAGFDGIALRADRWREMQAAGWDTPRIQSLLQEHGLVVSEIEPLRFLRNDLLESVAEMAQGLHVPRVQVTPPIDGSAVSLEATAQWLNSAAVTLSGIQLAIEFLPPTNVPDAPAAQRLIDMAGGAPNLGLCVDSWHVFRGTGLASIQGVDPDRVFMVQINDGTLAPTIPDYIEDCLCYRLPCGQGGFDLAKFMQLLPASAPVNVEVINTELDKGAPTDVARLLYQTTERMLEQCGRR